MQIVAMLAVLGATLGQPDDPPDQDLPAAEQQDEQQQAEPPEASADSYAAEQQQAEQQTESSAAGDQPGETGSDEASAELDTASGWNAGMGNWIAWATNFVGIFAAPDAPYSTFGPFTIQNVRRRIPRLSIDVAVQGRGHSPEQWSGFEEQVRDRMCAMDGREFTRHGGIFEMIIRDEAGESRTVTITDCGEAPHTPR